MPPRSNHLNFGLPKSRYQVPIPYLKMFDEIVTTNNYQAKKKALKEREVRVTRIVDYQSLVIKSSLRMFNKTVTTTGY